MYFRQFVVSLKNSNILFSFIRSRSLLRKKNSRSSPKTGRLRNPGLIVLCLQLSQLCMLSPLSPPPPSTHRLPADTQGKHAPFRIQFNMIILLCHRTYCSYLADLENLAVLADWNTWILSDFDFSVFLFSCAKFQLAVSEMLWWVASSWVASAWVASARDVSKVILQKHDLLPWRVVSTFSSRPQYMMSCPTWTVENWGIK